MLILKYTQFLEQLEKGTISPVYFFTGEENYFKNEAVKRIEKILFTEETKQFNYNIYNASEVNAQTVVTTLSTVPFLSEKRLVIVRNIENWTEDDKDIILKYLDKLLSSSCLILLTTRINFADNLVKKVAKLGKIVDFAQLSERELVSWIEKKFTEYDKKISLQVAETLLELNGTNLFDLSNEIEKICLYTSERNVITEDDLIGVSAQGRVYRINEFLNTLFEKGKVNALNILENLFAENEEALRILGAIIWRIRLFLYALSLSKESKLPTEEIIRKLRISKSMQKNFSTQLSRLNEKDLVKYLNYCLNTDFEIKTGKKNSVLALENLVLSLCEGSIE